MDSSEPNLHNGFRLFVIAALPASVLDPIKSVALWFDRVKKLTADAKFEPSEVKAAVAALLFVLETSARHGVDGETLGSELQQLGLPREHAAALCRVYSDNLTSISSRLQDQSLRLSRLQDVQWRMDTVVVDKSQMVGELRVGVRVFYPASGTHHTHNFNISAQQLHLLLADGIDVPFAQNDCTCSWLMKQGGDKT
ncbi:hypothetical protein Cfor_10117 [Coptotermes formosanus]|uniref:COMM domain-containing protein n=1 Tax=Coptotermes formosanus TaxID=36987 RepID=A0A6L2PS03_COPFO|nr:hypothetical protein Cfor_10117 [Coptotermes formosanus]